MFTDIEKAQCVLWLAEMKSPISVRRRFRREFNKDPPHVNAIRRWSQQFTATGSVSKRKSTGRPRISEETVEHVSQSCSHSPKKSLTRRSLELDIPRATVHKIMHKRLRLYPYKIQLLHEIKPDDQPKRTEFAALMLQKAEEDPTFLSSVMFTDEATFHIYGR